MSENIGKNIKTLAVVSVTVSIVLCVIFGLILISTGSGPTGDGSLVFSGFVVILVGIFAAIIEAFILYGFGELITSVKTIENKFTQMQLQGVPSAAGDANGPQAQPVKLERMPYFSSEQTSAEPETSTGQSVAPQKMVKCAHCGKENPSFEVNCQYCGQSLV